MCVRTCVYMYASVCVYACVCVEWGDWTGGNRAARSIRKYREKCFMRCILFSALCANEDLRVAVGFVRVCAGVWGV